MKKNSYTILNIRLYYLKKMNCYAFEFLLNILKIIGIFIE